MSWRVNSSGRAAAVRAALERQFDSIQPIDQAKADMKEMAADLILAALEHQNDNTGVKVEATGEILETNDGKYPKITIKIEPLWSFVA